ncbi:efflux RND transporter periplasmic adaptor subunit [Chromatiaceae bacterium AAb-1]|nr:efflux RND transporter periplasmic adaptor subunit [Chromatiaceae bacterium AAb-1]
MSAKNTIKTFMLGSIAAVVLAACGNPEAAAPAAATAPVVTVAEVIHERITEWDEFTGRLQAPETVTLVPRVSGYIEQIHFREGAFVKAGEPLLQIDPRPFRAEVQRLRAELQNAETAQVLADNDFERAEKLSTQRAISEEVLDSRLARKRQAAATVASVKAALERAELDLAYTRVTSPIDGRVSYAQITAGNYVTAGQSELTRIVSNATMYAYFDVDEQTWLKYMQLTADGRKVDTRNGASPVYMALANDIEFRHTGSIDFVDNAINQQTGTIRVRASFRNEEQTLLPGLFARIRLAGSAPYHGILIDDKAIGTDLNNKFVLVLNEKNQVEYRTVILGERLNGLRIVQSGLNPQEKIVVNGLQRVMPNMVVEPQLTEMTSSEKLLSLRSRQQQLEQHLSELTAQAELPGNRG